MTKVDQPEIVLYDLACTKNVCFSPVVWKVRLMLNYKKIPYKTVFLELPDIELTLKELQVISNSTFPTIQHVPTGVFIMDSLRIAEFLESTHPNPSVSLLSDLGLEIESKGRSTIGPAFAISIVPRENLILSPRSQEYFRAKNEAKFGCKLEDLLDTEEKTWEGVREKMEELNALMMMNGGPFIMGEMPSYTDFFIAASLQSAKTVDEGAFERCVGFAGFRRIYEACLPWMEKKD
ncbi:uncharacterized protein FIESC28_08271 [Fusarium coffeatum]|uniref:Uncharacterized protein n=1 Tax=Fusarium coffeatum TaxID=231269 RepID=A0A366RAS4_9HYPO|nr:uncharacterized protein FIESC28_08271 [Fusarium coffeatum]RBR13305.1 hypothetical protein FIESC28_08271 [Fusarium coffeatum]